MTKRIISATLTLVIFILLLLSCADGAKTGQKDSTSESEGETTAQELVADVPESDMQGRVFGFLTCNWPGEAIWDMTDITASEMNGDALNDAKYNRNLNVQSRFDCGISEKNMPSVGDAVSQFRRSITAGDNAYDFILPRMQSYMTLGADGLTLDLKTLPYLDFTKPWWDQNSVKALSLANKLFGVCGDITTQDKAATSAIVFNKGLAEDHTIESPYGLVKDGAWTLETFTAILKRVSDDLDGNSVMDEKDRYGFLYQRDSMLAFLSGSGEMIARKDENDEPYITLTEETAIKKLMDVIDVLYQKDICFNVMTLQGDFNVGMDKMFKSNQGLFLWIRMANVVPLRAMETDFGILPIPKNDENQKEYSSDVNSWTSICISVATTTPDKENVGIFLEAYAAESYKLVHPAYYDALLYGKVARDEESREMLGLIFGNRTYDIGAIGMFGTLNDILYMPMTYDRNVKSFVDKRLKTANREIERLMKKIHKLDDVQ